MSTCPPASTLSADMSTPNPPPPYRGEGVDNRWTRTSRCERLPTGLCLGCGKVTFHRDTNHWPRHPTCPLPARLATEAEDAMLDTYAINAICRRCGAHTVQAWVDGLDTNADPHTFDVGHARALLDAGCPVYRVQRIATRHLLASVITDSLRYARPDTRYVTVHGCAEAAA